MRNVRHAVHLAAMFAHHHMECLEELVWHALLALHLTARSPAIHVCALAFDVNGMMTSLCCFTGANCALSATCTASTECTTCNTGYFYNTTLHRCQSCDVSCRTCNSSTPTDCLSCNTGFVYASGTCASCDDGYHAVTVGSALTCPSCGLVSTGCIACTDGGSSQCTQCDAGYGLNNGACELCSASQLSDGYTPCHSCSRCATSCNASTECDSCNVGYFYSGSHACATCL